MSALLTAAVRRIRPSIVTLQLAGNTVAGLCAAAWLQIPDSHAWQLAFSALLAVLIVAGFFLLHAVVIRRVRLPSERLSIWLGALLLFLWMLVAYGFSTSAGHINNNAMRRAGYLNSQLSSRWRAFFSFQHLYAWQNDVVTVIVWFLIPAVLLPFVVETVACGTGRRYWRNSLAVLRRWQHWLTVGLAAGIIVWLTKALVEWHPAHSVRGELFSVAVRLGLLYLLDILIVTLVLAIIAELLARSDFRWNAIAEPPAQRVEPVSES